MKKSMKLLLVLIAIVLLAGCNNSKPEVKDNNTATTVLLSLTSGLELLHPASAYCYCAFSMM